MVGALALAWVALGARPAAAQTTLWTNGDSAHQGYSGWYNYIESGSHNGGGWATFENFTVTDPAGWRVTNLWSHTAYNVGNAGYLGTVDWSIRTGMVGGDFFLGGGDPGTILFSGTAAPGLETFVQDTGNGLEYRYDVSGLLIDLAPGTYWFNVTPYTSTGIGDGAVAQNSTGANAVGMPTMDGDAIQLQLDNNAAIARPGENWAMGVGGVSLSATPTEAVPEPATLLLLLPGLAAVGYMKRRRNGEDVESEA